MKICLINNRYKPFCRGGAEKIVGIIKKNLEAENVKVFIITLKPLFSNIKKINKKKDIYYLKSFYFLFEKSPIFIRFFWHLLDFINIVKYFEIRNIIKKEKADVVITNNLKGISFLLPLISKEKKIKFIHILHDIQLLHPSGLLIYNQEEKINSLSAKIYQLLTKILFNNIFAVISPSDWLLNKHKKLGFFSKTKNIVLPNPSTFNFGYAEEKQHSNIFKILYVGQIVEHKGISDLISAYLDFKENNNIYLEIVGEFDSKNLFYKKNNSKIKFLGRLNKENVYKKMSEASCLVVPSRCYENYPTVITEAFSLKIPVIVSRIGGNIELIHKYGGILYSPGSIEDLKNKLIWAYKNPILLEKIGKSAYNKYINNNNKNYIKKLIKIINNY